MPWLIHRSRSRHVESDLHDPVVGPEHGFTYGDHPRVRHEVGESAQPLGMDLHVIALRPATDRAVRPSERFLEQRFDVVAHPFDPGALEGAFERDDAVAVQAAHDRRDVIGRGRRLRWRGPEVLRDSGAHSLLLPARKLSIRQPSTSNANTVRELYSSSGRSTTGGNARWFGESGKCCVSRQKPARWPYRRPFFPRILPSR